MTVFRKAVVAGGVAAAVVLGTAAAANASDQRPREFGDELSCQTTGNIWAQQGLIHGFHCVNGGRVWYLNTW